MIDDTTAEDLAADVTAPYRPTLADMLGATEALVRKYVVADEHATCTLALHAAHTHAFDAADTTLYINVTSAAPESGKTRVFEVAEHLVRAPFNVVDPSTAALFRMVDAYRSTVLMDEIDVVFAGNKEERSRIIGLLNAGYRDGAAIPRVIDGSKDARPPKLFKIFSPKMFAGIGTVLPPATLSRTATIRLKAKKAGEQAARLRLREIKQEAAPIREALAAWAADRDVIDALSAARPTMPDGLRDRQMDAWEPLFAIADMAGGDWPDRARLASLALVPALEGGAVGVRLLNDLKGILRAGEEHVHLKEIAWRLNVIEDAGWGGWNDGNGVTPREIARHLRAFEIETDQFKIDGLNGKGYAVAAFGDAFERYLKTPGNPGSPDPRLPGYPAGQSHYSAESQTGQNPTNPASDQGGNRVTGGIGTLSYPAHPYASESNGSAESDPEPEPDEAAALDLLKQELGATPADPAAEFIRSWNGDVYAQARARHEAEANERKGKR
jgi:hypothetical protein